MAEINKDTAGNVTANRPSAVDVPLESVADLIEQAPEPSDEAKGVFRVQYPDDNFVMEGMPVVTAAGTPLTDAQAQEILPVAEASGVRIVQVES